jgi:ATP-dependent RNA helicase DDX27
MVSRLAKQNHRREEGDERIMRPESDPSESDFEIENIDLEGLSGCEEDHAGVDKSIERGNKTWQLGHEDLPINPNQLATPLSAKIFRHGQIGDFTFAADGSDIIDAVEANDQVNNSLLNSSSVAWGELGLSRPVLKSISQVLKFPYPTNIQCSVIPASISGKDILATAATGSGKTAAFLLPIIERILQSPNVLCRRKDKESGRITGGRPAVRALVLLPTRELAVQCWSMFKALTSFVPITASLIVGGFDSKDQKVDLSKSPDVIIATPGRLLDHVLNSQGVHLDTVDMVVLDEADRLLEMGFKDSITEILKAIPKKTLALKKGKTNASRGQCQTLLFSATLSSGVKDLAAFILSDAVTARITDPSRVVSSLVQEFVKLGREDVRESAFFSLLESVVHTSSEDTRCKGRVIVFFREKKEAHRVATIAQIFGLPVAELNGNMNQVERLASMADFQSGRKRYLFATDIAGRGLDLPNVELVINFRLPFEMDAEVRYIHRVGRTARMGRSGRSITLYTAEEYPVVKRIVKQSVDRDDRDRIFERKISVELSQIWAERIRKIGRIIKEIDNEEKLEQEIYVSSKKIAKVENLSKHNDKIKQRPQKMWIQEQGKRKTSWTKPTGKRPRRD